MTPTEPARRGLRPGERTILASAAGLVGAGVLVLLFVLAASPPKLPTGPDRAADRIVPASLPPPPDRRMAPPAEVGTPTTAPPNQPPVPGFDPITLHEVRSLLPSIPGARVVTPWREDPANDRVETTLCASTGSADEVAQSLERILIGSRWSSAGKSRATPGAYAELAAQKGPYLLLARIDRAGDGGSSPARGASDPRTVVRLAVFKNEQGNFQLSSADLPELTAEQHRACSPTH